MSRVTLASQPSSFGLMAASVTERRSRSVAALLILGWPGQYSCAVTASKRLRSNSCRSRAAHGLQFKPQQPITATRASGKSWRVRLTMGRTAEMYSSRPWSLRACSLPSSTNSTGTPSRFSKFSCDGGSATFRAGTSMGSPPPPMPTLRSQTGEALGTDPRPRMYSLGVKVSTGKARFRAFSPPAHAPGAPMMPSAN